MWTGPCSERADQLSVPFSAWKGKLCGIPDGDGVLCKKGADLDEICGIIAGALGCGKEDALKEMFLLLEKIYPNIKKGSTGAKADLCRSMAKTVLETQKFLINNGPAVFSEDEITEMFMSCL